MQRWTAFHADLQTELNGVWYENSHWSGPLRSTPYSRLAVPWYDMGQGHYLDQLLANVPWNKRVHKAVVLGPAGSGKTTLLRCLSQDKTMIKLEDADSELTRFKKVLKIGHQRTITHLFRETWDTASIRAAEIIWFVVGFDQIIDPSEHQAIREMFDQVRAKNHRSPCCIIIAKSDLIPLAFGMNLEQSQTYWRIQLLGILGLTPDQLALDAAQLNRLAERKPWVLDPEAMNRGIALTQLVAQAMYPTNWCLAHWSAKKAPTGGILKWSNCVWWDLMSSVGAQRENWLRRRRSSWRVQRLVFLAAETEDGVLWSVPQGVLRLIAKYAVWEFVEGYERSCYDFTEVPTPKTRACKQKAKKKMSAAQKKLLKQGLRKVEGIADSVLDFVMD